MTMSNTGTQSNSARHEEFQRRMALQQRNSEIEARNSVQQRLAEDLGDERPTYGYSWEPLEQVPEMQEFVPGRVSVKEGDPRTAGSSRRQNFASARENLENLMGGPQAPLKEGPSGRRSPPTGEEYYQSGEKVHSPRLDALISQNLSGLSLKEGAGRPSVKQFDDSSNPFADIEEDLHRSQASYRSPPPPPQLPAPGLTSPPATMPSQHSQTPPGHPQSGHPAGYPPPPPQSGYPPHQHQYPQSGHPGYPPPPPHLQQPGMMQGYHPQYPYYQPGQQPYQHMPTAAQGGFGQMHQQAEPARNLQKAPAAGSKSDDFDDDFLDIIRGSTEAAKPKTTPQRPKSKDVEQEDKDYAIALLLQEQEEEKYKKEQEEKRKKKEEAPAAAPTPRAGSSQPPPRPGIQLSGRVLPNMDFSSPNTIRHEQIRYFAARVVNQAIHYLIPGGQANVGKKVHVVDILEDALLMSGIEGATIYSLEQYEWLVNQVRRIIQPAFMIRNYSSRHVSIDVHEYGIFSSKSLLLKRSYLSARVRNILTAFMTKQRDTNTSWSTS